MGSDQKSIYQQEAADQLAQVEELILELETIPNDREALNRLFRVFHTIKGSGAMFGFEEIAAFTHHVETILDRLRKGRASFDRQLVDLILEAKDCIAGMLKDPAIKANPDLLARVQSVQVGVKPQAAPAKHVEALRTRYRIRICFSADVFERGLDPAGIFNDLRRLGACTITVNTDQVPLLDSLDPVRCYLSWEVVLESDSDLNAVKDVFIFVEDDQGISIHSEPIPDPILTGSEHLLNKAPVRDKGLHPAQEAAVEVSKGEASAALEPVVRVPASRLDQLVNLVGELVINHSRLQQISKKHEFPELSSVTEDLERLIANLRDHTLGIRMTPIGSTFVRFKRLVRDLAAELGKEAELHCSGEETELDKTMLDQLGEPLMHLIRNALDHGISVPEERLKQGKARSGRISLSASHEGAHVIVRIQDDGRGLDRQAIFERAVERGLIKSGEKLSDHELCNLVFLPGFSTARTISNVSGRGVGMDVVKRQVESLRGSVSISSEAGQGTLVTLVLPLTLAIIDGLLVGVGGDSFILPLSLVDENVEILPGECATGNGRNLIAVRDELVPYVRLRSLFGIDGDSPSIERVVIVRARGQRLGLVVDRILGTHQTVVQSLGRFYRDVVPVSGATILGDGQVALILDVGGLVKQINRSSPWNN